MKGSGSKVKLSSEQEEPSNAVEPTRADLGVESYAVHDQRDVGEGSILAVSEAIPQSIQAGSGLESCSLPDAELGLTKGYSGVAVQPTQPGLGLESHGSQEQPNIEEVAIQADSGVDIRLPQAGSRLESQNFQEQANVEEGAIHALRGIVVQPTQADLGSDPLNLQDKKLSVEESDANAVQPNQVALSDPSHLEAISIEDLHAILHTGVDDEEREILEEVLQLTTGQGEAPHQGEAGINDTIAPQAPSFDVNNLRNDHTENSHQEEEAGLNDRNVLQVPSVDMGNFRSDDPIMLAGSDPVDNEEEIGIQARQAGQQQMQDGPPQQGTARRRMRLQVPLCGAEGRSEPKCVSTASSERTGMCGGMSLEQEAEKEGGDVIGPLRTKGLIACATELDNVDGSQKNFQDVSGFPMRALIFVRLFRSLCRLTRMAFTYV